MRAGVYIFLGLILTVGFVAFGLYDWARLSSENEFLHRRTTALAEDNQRLSALVTDQEINARAAANAAIRTRIERDVERIRGLKFVKPVNYAELDRADLRDKVLSLLEDQITDEEFENASTTLAALGFLAHDVDLKSSLVELLSEQIAAFYDQHSHQLYMFRGTDLSRADQRIILAHELTHALQDQHFALRKLPLELKDNDDRVAATQALIEGDATLAMSMFMLQEMAGDSPLEILGLVFTQPMEKLLQTPRYLRETLVFPYLAGQQFATAIHAVGGFEALNDAFRAPPTSTAQIFDTSKFLAPGRVEPVDVRWRDSSVHGQEPLLENTAGELGIRLLFKEWLGREVGEAVGSGWAGDRYRSYAASGQRAVHTVWRIGWATPEDAQEYLAACEKLLMKRYKPGDAVREAESFSFDSPRVVRLKKIAPIETILVEARDTMWAEALLNTH